MDIVKSYASLEPTVLFYTPSTHDCHLLNKGKGLIVLWCTGDLCAVLNHVNCNYNVPSVKVHSKLVLVMINSGSVNACVEFLDKFRTIVCIKLRIIIHKAIPISFSNPIQSTWPYPSVSVKILEKSFLAKIDGAMDLKIKICG